MTWMRSRLPEVGSFTAQTTKVGAVPLHRRQVRAHGHAVGIGLMHPVPGVQDVLVVAPAAEEAHLDVRAADAEGLLAIHRVPDGGASVFLGPHAGQSAGVLQAHIQMVPSHDPSHAPFDGSIDLRVATEEIVLAVRTAGVVRVGATGHAELVRVVAARVLHGDAVFQRLAGDSCRDVIDAANVGRQTEQAVNSS